LATENGVMAFGAINVEEKSLEELALLAIDSE
jgi:hypothetical protein